MKGRQMEGKGEENKRKGKGEEERMKGKGGVWEGKRG